MQWKSPQRLAFAALLGGATGIGFAPILVRLSEVGPSATAFYRILFALPFLWLFISLERPGISTQQRPQFASLDPQAAAGSTRLPVTGAGWRGSRALWPCAAAGAFFAGDLAFWHWSIKLTTVANSTLLTNCAPFFVMLGARILFAERITIYLLLGLAAASAGAAMLVGASFQTTPSHLTGDFLALITAGFYGAYLLTIKYLRSNLSTARILAWSGVVSCILLWIVAFLSGETILASSPKGWTVLLCLGLVSHIGGQGLIAYALAHLPAGFSSVGLLLQPVVAAVLAYVLLSEPLSLLQIAGGVVILAGILIAVRSQTSH